MEIEVEVEKSSPTRIPMSVVVGFNGMIETSRSFEPEVVEVKDETGKVLYKYNPGKVMSWGDWVTDFTMNLKVGVKLAY